MLITSKMCMTKDVGINGNLFGGNMMAWVDEACAIFAHQKTGEKQMVTLKFKEMLFKKSVKVGDILEFNCNEKWHGNKSITIHVEVTRRGYTVFVTEAIFVAIDKDGQSKTIIWGIV